MRTTFQTAFLSVGFLSLPIGGSLRAADVVVSNLGVTPGPTSLLEDSDENPLPLGSQVSIRDFGGLSALEVADLAQAGPLTLVTASVAFGSPGSVGTGDGAAAGTIEYLVTKALAVEQDGLHLVVFNAPAPEEATEVIVLKIPGTIAADVPGFLPSFRSLAVDDMELVYGRTTSGGFAAETSGRPTTGFEAWIYDQFDPEGSPDEFFLPTSDPDDDGAENLLEYAFGSQASVADSVPRTMMRQEGAVFYLQYLKRLDDEDLNYKGWWRPDISAGSWIELTGSADPVTSAPAAAPENYGWVEQVVPTSGPWSFGRVSVQRN
ncbi:hypothetical protein [Haloferula sp.]|uniref:hypothetical protein n=1 Tax=Haloferula sp. TaxID=2497595 RepID=UPI003C753E68